MKTPAYIVKSLVIIVCILFSGAAFSQRNVTSMPFYNADPDLLVRATRPLLSPGSSVSYYHNQLIINATPEETANIERLLKQLDGSGQQIVFTLRSDGASGLSSEQVRVSGNLGTNSGIDADSKPGLLSETRTTVTVDNRRLRGGHSGAQSVRATEGYAAFVATGNSAPFTRLRSRQNGQIYQQSEPQDINSGFYATAWIDGDTVSVDIDQRNDQYQQGTVSTQQLQTRVSGKLGSWMAIGMLIENQQAYTTHLTRRSSNAGNNSTMLYLKVDLVP